MTLSVPDIAAPPSEPHRLTYREIGVAAVAAALAEPTGESAAEAPQSADLATRQAA